jgi:hypothetical protein
MRPFMPPSRVADVAESDRFVLNPEQKQFQGCIHLGSGYSAGPDISVLPKTDVSPAKTID